MQAYLADIWLFLIGFFLLYYAIGDGFDLGIGIISLFSENDHERGVQMSALAGIWHDNQTWLVLLGGMLFGAFPAFYSLVLSSMYIPILVMLFGLVFRGVSFEFRERSEGRKLFWGISFGLGSLLVALSQGFALGGLLQGVRIDDWRFAGNVWDWFSPYSCLVASGVLFGYVMLGSGFLILKTVGRFQHKAYRIAWTSSVVTLAISLAVHAWTVSTNTFLKGKILSFPGNLPIAVFLMLAAASFAMYFRSLRRRRERSPFMWNAALILFSFMGLSFAMYPNMIPNLISSSVTVHEAAASSQTLGFMLVTVTVILPVILTYTAYKHKVFGGKVGESGYGQE